MADSLEHQKLQQHVHQSSSYFVTAFRLGAKMSRTKASSRYSRYNTPVPVLTVLVSFLPFFLAHSVSKKSLDICSLSTNYSWCSGRGENDTSNTTASLELEQEDLFPGSIRQLWDSAFPKIISGKRLKLGCHETWIRRVQ